MSIKRYEDEIYGPSSYDFEESESGSWVKYEDHAAEVAKLNHQLISVVGERDSHIARLKEQVRAQAAESLQYKRFFESAWRVAMDGCDFDGAGIQGLAVNLGLAKAEVYDSEKHSDLVSDASDFEDGCEVFFPVKSLNADAILNEVRAQGCEMFIEFNRKLAKDYPHAMVAKALEVTELNGEQFAARIRAGEVQR